MPARRRAAAAFMSIALCGGLHVATWKPLAVQAIAAPGIISTYAGGAGSGTATGLAQSPWGLAVSGSTVYITDFNGGVVRALNTGTGIETVIAGTGTTGDSGQGGLATAAELNEPASVAVDSSGNVFIGSYARVQRVDHSTGIITAFAGTGVAGFSGDLGLATSAQIGVVWGVAVDSAGDVFLADTSNHRIRRVDHSTGIITTIGGTTEGFSGDTGPATSAKLDFPMGLSIDSSDNIFVADNLNNRIREISGGIINTVAGTTQGFSGDGAAATAAQLSNPRHAYVDGSGNLWIADTGNSRVREVDHATGHINTVAGDGTVGSGGDGGAATAAQLNTPFNAIVDGSGHLFISDFQAKRVREVSSGTITTAAGTGTDCSKTGDGGAATAATFCNPWGLAVDGSGDLFIVDQGNQVIREVNSGGIISTFAGNGTQGSSGDTGSATAAELSDPNAVAVDGSGNVYIADTGNNVVRKVSSGTITLFAGNYTPGLSGDGAMATSAQLNRPTGLAFDSGGNLYIADASNSRIRKVTPGGVISTFAGTTYGNSGDGGPATAAQLKNPYSVAVDGSDNVYINDYDIGNIRKVDGSGTISVAATGSVRTLAAGPGNRIFTASDFTQQVSMLSGGTLVPVAGTGALGFSGDGGPSTAAELYYPTSVAVDSSGNIFIADFHNQRIRRVQAFQNPTAPLSVIASPGAYSAKVRWSPPASAGGLPITSYLVTPSSGPPVGHAGSPPLIVTVGGLDPTSSYTFTVTAATAWGSSGASAASNSITPLLVDPGGIRTNAGSAGYGPALSLGQFPYSLAVSGNHIYVGDLANPVVRDISNNLGTGQENVLAGNDSYGYSGNGGLANSAMVFGAGAIASCGGNTYIADTLNFVIRKIDGSGIITTVAGTGVSGFSGDGGPATKAQISRVLGLACRAGGGLYISDSDNGRIRILDNTGNIDTWWYGFGFPTSIVETGGFDVVDVSDTGFNQVWGLDDFRAVVVAGAVKGTAGSTGDGGPATKALLRGPRGLLYYNGTLYIADTGNNRVRRVSAGVITNLAGTGTAGFNGDGSAPAAALLNQPSDLGIMPGIGGTPDDWIFVADSNNFRVRLIRLNPCSPTVCGPQISTFAGNGTPSWSGDGGQATSAQLGNPFAVAFDAAGNEYVADNQNNAIRKITTAGVITTVAGIGVSGFSGDGSAATGAMLNDVRGVAVNAAGDIFLSDAGNQRIRRVDHISGNITTVAGNGSIGSTGDGGAGTSAQLNFPTALVVDGSGNLYIADTGNNRVRVLSPGLGGAINAFAGTGTAGYNGDTGLATAALLNGPRGLAIDASGNVVIADTLNHRVRKVASGTGIITTIAGNGQHGLSGDLHAATSARLASPHGLAFDPAGNLFIADTDNERIRVVDTHGIITSVVGNCGIVAAFSGDGGPADLAHVNAPFGLATNAVGNLFIAEINSNRVRIASVSPGARHSSCTSQGGTSGGRGVTNGHGGPPGTRIPQGSPASLIPMPANMPAGTTETTRPTHAAPTRHSTRVTSPSRQTASVPQRVNVQAAPEVMGSANLAMAVRPATSAEPISPWYAALLLPIAVLVVALVVQWRRQRE